MYLQMCLMKENMKILQDRLLRETVSLLSGQGFKGIGRQSVAILPQAFLLSFSPVMFSCLN